MHASLRLFLVPFAVFLISIVLVTGCAPEPSLTPNSISSPFPPLSKTGTPTGPITPQTPTVPSGSIVLAGVGQPSREVTNLPRFVAAALYDSLLQVDPSDGSLKPGLADSWQVSNDARTFTFHLRPGVKWHDGAPLSARDAAFTLRSLSASVVRLTPAADLGPISDVLAPDSQTLIVRMAEPYCPALTSIATVKILPEHIFASSGSSQDSRQPESLSALTNSQMVGTGPLTLKDWNADAITFAANMNYWNGPPGISTWTYKSYPDLASADTALTSGQADLLALDAGPVRGSLPATGLNIYTHPAAEFYGLAINRERQDLADPRIAQALAFALNRPKLAADFYGGDAVPLQVSILPGFWTAPAEARQPAYDPARARQLFGEAGWSDTDGDGILDKKGRALTLTLWAMAGDPIDEPLAFAVRQMLSEVGVQAVLELDDRAELLTRLFSHEFDLAIAPWNIPLDPDQHWYWLSTENKPGEGLNIASYLNPQVDELLKQGIAAASCDPAERRGIYSELYRLVAGDIPEVFLFAPPAFMATHTRVSGIEPSPFAGDFWNLASWEMAP